jgi:hypothetical protein
MGVRLLEVVYCVYVMCVGLVVMRVQVLEVVYCVYVMSVV